MKKVIILISLLFCTTLFAEVQYVEQKSAQRKTWFDLEVTQDGNNISIPAGSFYLHSTEYEMEAVTNESFPDGARLCIEKTDTGADYYLDTTGYGVPVSFGENIGAPMVVWRVGNIIYVLRHVEE